MSSIYKNTNFLIISDSKTTLDAYGNIFNKFFLNINKNLLTKKTNSLDFQQIDILLLDISTLANLKTIYEKLKTLKKQIIILLVPISRKNLILNFPDLQIFKLILTKPVDIRNLIAEVCEYGEEIENKILLKDKNNILINIFDQNPDEISIYSNNEKLFFGNRKFLNKNGLSRKDYDVKNFDELNKLEFRFNDIVHSLRNGDNEVLNVEKKIDLRWYKFTFFRSNDGHLVCISSDITENKSKEKKLEESAIFFEHSSEGIIITNENNKIVSVNNAFCKITGYTKDEVLGKNPSILNSGMHDKNFYEFMWESIKNRKIWHGEIYNKRKNGEIYPQWLAISEVSSIDNSKYYIAIFNDLTTLKEADKKIYYYANHDSLTSLYNRANFEKKMGETITKLAANNSKFALYFIDIDNFKYVNDTYGHDIGDEIIKIVAKRIEKIIRKNDIFARIGGDEFTLIQENVKSRNNILTFVKKIISTVTEVIKIDDKYFNITLSIGISIYPDDSKDKKGLLKAADTAMYVVKESGRNGFKLFQKDFAQEIEKKFNIQNQLRNAIANEDIDINFQPFYEISTNKMIGAEVLARWNHKDLGIIPPNDFIDYAEKSDLIAPLTLLVVKKSCEAMVKFKQKINGNFVLALNISGKHFYDKEFENTVFTIIDDFSLSPCDFELELTETYLMNNYKQSINIINKLKNIGFKFALDDFGTGYSSLSYLKNFKIDKLKIDKSFIDDCHIETSDFQIVKTIIEMGKIFNFKVQAEGVETKEQLDILKKLGCNYVQGYYYNKPLEYKLFLNLIEEIQKND